MPANEAKKRLITNISKLLIPPAVSPVMINTTPSPIPIDSFVI